MDYVNLYNVIITNMKIEPFSGRFIIIGDVETKFTKQRGIVGVADSEMEVIEVFEKIEDYNWDQITTRKTRTRWKQDHWEIQDENHKGWRRNK